MNNKFIVKCIALVIAVLLVTVAITYAFFSINIHGENSKVGFVTNLMSIPQVIFSAEEDTTMVIDPSDLPKKEGDNNYTKYISNTASVSTRIINDAFSDVSSCTYSIIYTPIDIYTPSQTDYREYTVTGSANVSDATSSITSTDEIDLDNVNSPIYLVQDATIDVSGANTDGKVDWVFTFKYYNLGVNQNSKAGTTISGKISFANIRCLGKDPINEIEIDEPYEAPKPIVLTNDLNSNGKADEGDKVCIGGTECFYVISNTGGKVKALAEWNLLVGNQYDGSTTTPLENPTGMQSETAKGNHYAAGTTTIEYPSIGTVAFSSDSYWPNENGAIIDITDSRNTIYPYLTAYKTTLEGLGANISDITLITKQEIETLINDGNSLSGGKINTKADAKGYSWLYNTTYWTRAAYNDDRVWNVRSSSLLTYTTCSYRLSTGVRPVIEFSK